MAIGRATAKLLMEEGLRRPFSGSVITAGRQHVGFSGAELEKWAGRMGYKLDSHIDSSAFGYEQNTEGSRLRDDQFLRLLGFSGVDSIDISDFEQCTIVHDLNEEIPVHLHAKYDVVFDGAAQHIFNVPKVLQNFFHLLKVGGRVIHLVPLAGWINLGYWTFSPILIFDYYTANNWNLESIILRKCSRFPFTKCHVFEFDPQKPYFPAIPSDAFHGRWNMHVVATKREDSFCHVIPQQSSYMSAWQGNERASGSSRGLVGGEKAVRNLSLALPQPLREFFIVLMGKIGPFQLKKLGRY